MEPAQLPGSLFVALVALVAYATGQWDALMLLALGCAFGWVSFSPDTSVAVLATWTALALWALTFILVLVRILH